MAAAATVTEARQLAVERLVQGVYVWPRALRAPDCHVLSPSLQELLPPFMNCSCCQQAHLLLMLLLSPLLPHLGLLLQSCQVTLLQETSGVQVPECLLVRRTAHGLRSTPRFRSCRHYDSECCGHLHVVGAGISTAMMAVTPACHPVCVHHTDKTHSSVIRPSCAAMKHWKFWRN